MPDPSPPEAALAPAPDLARYLSRIGLDATLTPDLPTLARLVEHHARAIAFENVDALAGRCGPLDAPGLQAKLVDRRRGGYCFEHNSLMAQVLTAVGFDLHLREGRVLTGQTDIGLTTRTHLMLQVALDGQSWLVDVGFGGLAPLSPVPFGAEGLRCADGRRYRLQPVPGGDLLSFDEGEGWRPAYRIEPGIPGPADLRMGHWYASTSPDHFLRRNLSLGRAVPGGRLTLFNRTLTLRRADAAVPDQTTLHTRAELADALCDGFDLDIATEDLDRIEALLESQDAARAP